MKHKYKFLLLNLIILANITYISGSTGGFNFINQTNSNVIVSNFSELGELDDNPTLMYNNNCYTWEKDSNIWTSEQAPNGINSISIDPGTNFWIGLTDRNLIDDSLSVLNVQVDNKPKVVSFVRNHDSGAWSIAGDYEDYPVVCPTDKAILKCLNYPDTHSCLGVTFNNSTVLKASKKKTDLKNAKEKK